MNSKFWIKAGLAAVIATNVAGTVSAQEFPTRPVRIIVPFGPGTAVDLITRQVGEALSKRLGQNVIIENRAGASGTIGSAAVATAAPDGYTLISNASTHVSAKAFVPKLSYDPIRDFAGITTISTSQLVMVTAPSNGFKTVADMIAAARAKPGTLSYASAGEGSSTHLTAEKLRVAANLNMLHVPFKSTTDAITEVVAGRVTYTYTGVASALALIKDNRLMPLAIGGSRRSGALPNVPTIEEIVPGASYPGWLGILAPAKTPRPIINRLYTEIDAALKSPDLAARITGTGNDAWSMKPEEFDAMMRREAADLDTLVKALK